jgi:FKBP-type peptidyl-prolyl cis-trans isomerase SlyD
MRIKFPALILGVALFEMLLAMSAVAAEGSKDDKVIKTGSLVSLQYTLSGEDGKTIETNKGKEPIKYVQGQNMMIPGLEKELAGMKIGQEKHVKVKPEDGYGQVDPRRYQEFPKDKIPPDELKQIKVGSMVPLTAPNGQTYTFPVTEIKEKTIVVNLNHPMAGKTLVFDVKVLDIQPSPPPAPSNAGQPPQPGPAAKPAQPATPAPPK